MYLGHVRVLGQGSALQLDARRLSTLKKKRSPEINALDKVTIAMHFENVNLELPADVAVDSLLHDRVRHLGGGVARGMLKLYLVNNM